MTRLTDCALVIEFSGISNTNPWTHPDLTEFGTLKVASNVLNLGNTPPPYTAGVYAATAPTAALVEAYARVAYPSDLQGVMLVDPATGDGYAVRGTGSLRLYPVVDLEINTGSPLTFGSTTLADNDEYGLTYDGSTITVYKNDVSQFTYSATGTMRPGWLYNVDNVGAGGARALGFTWLDVSGPTIDSTPADIRVSESRTIRITAPTTLPTTLNTVIRIDDVGNSPITPSSVTVVSGLTVDVVFTVPDEYAGLPYSATGYPIIVTTTDGSVTSANVDFLPVTGNGYVGLTDVSDTDITSSPALEVADQIEWTNAAVITIGADGKVTSTEESATFEFRVWDHNDSTWGDWAEVVFGEGGGGGGSGGITISGLSSSGVSEAGITTAGLSR